MQNTQTTKCSITSPSSLHQPSCCRSLEVLLLDICCKATASLNQRGSQELEMKEPEPGPPHGHSPLKLIHQCLHRPSKPFERSQQPLLITLGPRGKPIAVEECAAPRLPSPEIASRDLRSHLLRFVHEKSHPFLVSGFGPVLHRRVRFFPAGLAPDAGLTDLRPNPPCILHGGSR